MPDFDKVRLNTAIDKRSRLSLDYHHVTTNDFMFMRPVFYRHVLPSEHGKIRQMAQFRLAPVAVPTYGRAKANVRTFFVPYRTIMPNWTEFITDTVAFSDVGSTTVGLIEGVPHFSSSAMLTLFGIGFINIGDVSIPLSEIAPNSSVCDFVYDGTARKLTPLGKACYAIFVGLGYQFVLGKEPGIVYNALNLLAFAKIWLDWYSQSAYMDTVLAKSLEILFSHSSLFGYELTYDDLVAILTASWSVNYDGDYFTAAWDEPVSPTQGNFSDFVIKDITNSSSNAVQNRGVVPGTGNATTPVIMNATVNGTLGSVSQYQLDALKSLNDYLRRNAISGSRAVDRYLARFGIQLSSEKLKRSIYYGNMMADITFGDVMSHADTSSSGELSNLGDYSGRGDGVCNKEFEYDAGGEYGVLMSVCSILPNAGIVQGYDRHNVHFAKTDFWTPEFDSLSVQAVQKGEVFLDRFNPGFVAGATDYQKTFGFVPTYAEYKVGRSFVSGDYACPASNIGGNSWHLNRMFDSTSFGNSVDNLVHSVAFGRGDDRQQYDRIFTNTTDANEHFNCVFHTNVDAVASCRSLFDTYDFKDEGKSIDMQTNGVKLN